MYLVTYLRRMFARHIFKPRWYFILSALLVYLAVSWTLLFLSGESELTGSSDFLYWIVVTASTVGYGDLSPTTSAGRWMVALFVIPVGLSLFALVIGRVAAYLTMQWRKGIKGMKHIDCDKHILVIGWNGMRTLQLVKLLLREQQYDPNPAEVVLCVSSEMDNPLPGQIGFVKVASFTDDEGMNRAGIARAKSIILDNERDDVTMTVALYCNSRNPAAHTIAYFRDEKLVPLLALHCPNIECTPSVAVEMMAKAAVDPGSSYLHHQLLAVDEGMTQYSVVYPKEERPRPVSAFFDYFKRKHQATLIGISNGGARKIDLNPPLEAQVEPGATIFYIADERIAQINWRDCDVR